MQLSGNLNWTMRTISEIEMWFSSVQRNKSYSEVDIEPFERSSGKSAFSDAFIMILITKLTFITELLHEFDK